MSSDDLDAHASKIQMCFRRYNHEKKIVKRIKALLDDKIRTHDNNGLNFYAENNLEKVTNLVDNSDYVSFYEAACESKNYECISILVRHGMGPDNINKKYASDQEMWYNSPLGTAFGDLDVDMIETLSRNGFLTGSSASCPDCYECGWPNTCLFETLFSPKEMDRISDEELIRIVRVSNWDHVLETYARSVTDYHGKEKLDIPRMNRILRIICKTIPVIRIKSVSLTERNDDHVMDMVHSNIMDLDDLLGDTINKFLSLPYLSFWDNVRGSNVPPLSVERVKNYMKDMIDLGADTSVSIDLKFTNYVTDLPTKEYVSMQIHYGSFEDILRTVIAGEEDTLDKNDDYPIEHLENVFDALKELYKHIKYKKREIYLYRRVRGFGENDEPDVVTRNLMQMDPSVFSNVMKFIV